jgi:hypothetical protein
MFIVNSCKMKKPHRGGMSGFHAASKGANAFPLLAPITRWG